jgi:hypothetical protein
VEGRPGRWFRERLHQFLEQPIPREGFGQAREIALEIDPDNFFALRNCGAVLGKIGQHEEAIGCLKEASRLGQVGNSGQA